MTKTISLQPTCSATSTGVSRYECDTLHSPSPSDNLGSKFDWVADTGIFTSLGSPRLR